MRGEIFFIYYNPNNDTETDMRIQLSFSKAHIRKIFTKKKNLSNVIMKMISLINKSK